jgi:hypothetical protein
MDSAALPSLSQALQQAGFRAESEGLTYTHKKDPRDLLRAIALPLAFSFCNFFPLEIDTRLSFWKLCIAFFCVVWVFAKGSSFRVSPSTLVTHLPNGELSRTITGVQVRKGSFGKLLAVKFEFDNKKYQYLRVRRLPIEHHAELISLLKSVVVAEVRHEPRPSVKVIVLGQPVRPIRVVCILAICASLGLTSMGGFDDGLFPQLNSPTSIDVNNLGPGDWRSPQPVIPSEPLLPDQPFVPYDASDAVAS